MCNPIGACALQHTLEFGPQDIAGQLHSFAGLLSSKPITLIWTEVCQSSTRIYVPEFIEPKTRMNT